jgi:hypothetical protein
MALAEVGQRPVHMAHRRVVAQMKGHARAMPSKRSRSGMAKTRWPLAIPLMVILPASYSAVRSHVPLRFIPICPKRDLDRGEFRVPAQPEREASLFPAEKSDRFCGA